MANQEQFEILKQGADVWNEWRRKNIETRIDLIESDLSGFYLNKADLSKANLTDANLTSTNLQLANLRSANLHRVNLEGTILDGADLRESLLWGANFFFTDLEYANLGLAEIGDVVFIDTDLSEAIGLETLRHVYSSYIDTRTLKRFKGTLPLVFLCGCGLSDWEIESAKLYNPDITNDEIVKIQYRIFELRATQALQISPLFISYSHADTAFVDRVDKSLAEKGVRFWRDIHDAKAGRLETQIDRAIRQNPTVLLVLSKNSLGSDWVEHEVRLARKLEKELGRDTLCPISLDDSWKSSLWPERVMEQIMEYNILDFSGWQDKSTFDRQFAKLLSGLEIFYKKPET